MVDADGEMPRFMLAVKRGRRRGEWRELPVDIVAAMQARIGREVSFMMREGGCVVEVFDRRLGW